MKSNFNELFSTIFNAFDEAINASFKNYDTSLLNEPLFKTTSKSCKYSLDDLIKPTHKSEISPTPNTKSNSRVYGVKFFIDKNEWDSTTVELNGNKLSVEAYKRNGENSKEKSLCTEIPSDVDKSTMRKRWDTQNHQLIVTFLRKKNK